jgi:hypothetical protein
MDSFFEVGDWYSAKRRSAVLLHAEFSKSETIGGACAYHGNCTSDPAGRQVRSVKNTGDDAR